MDKWLSVTELSDSVKVPESTVRRYLHKFERFFRYEQRGRGKKYHPESIVILKRITSLYDEGYESAEIKEVLSQKFAFTVGEIHEDLPSTTQPPHQNIEKQLVQLESFRQEQRQFNEELKQIIQVQQEYIANSLEERDRKMMAAMNELFETKKQLASTKKKKWWELWK
ncbi:MerR family transcriptional regulator [Bacillaceae bacterium S4-13-56]